MAYGGHSYWIYAVCDVIPFQSRNNNWTCVLVAGRVACGPDLVRMLASCLIGRCSAWFESRPGRAKTLKIGSCFSLAKGSAKWPEQGNSPTWMQPLLESGRVAYCLPIGTTSSKTKCMQSRNGQSLQHPKQVSARTIVEGTRSTILVLCSYIVCNLVLATALWKNFRQNVLVSSPFCFRRSVA